MGKSIRLDPQDVADWLRAKRPVAAHTGKQKASRVVRRIDQSQPVNGNARLQGVVRKKFDTMQAAAAIDASSERHSHSGN